MVVYREHAMRRPGTPIKTGALSYSERLRDFERSEISRALRSAEWNQAAAARLLALPEATLRYKVKTLDVDVPDDDRTRKSRRSRATPRRH